jgi:hypothetical protein
VKYWWVNQNQTFTQGLGAYERHCGAGKENENANEADLLSGELVIPAEAARQAVRRGAQDDQVAKFLGVSVQVARWRMNVSGACRVSNAGPRVEGQSA